MKTKTQIKRKAKRTLSLLLTAMLIISTMVVSLSVVNAAGSDGYQTACMHLIGDFTSQNWDSNQTIYDIDTAYNTGVSDGLFYYEATVTPNTTYYFALYSNDYRYAPATQHTVIANSKESAMSGDYSHNGNSWEYTSGANTTKVRICVDQYSPSEKWYPLVWIEDESVQPTTSAPTGEYYLWTSVGQNDLTNTSLWTKYPLSATSDGMYNVPSVAIPTENKDLYLTVTKTSDNPYNTMVWENQEAKNNSKNNSSYVGGIDKQKYYVSVTSKEYYFLRIYFKSRNGSLSVNYDPSTKGLIFADAGTESTTEEPTTVEPTTVEPTTIEPTTVEPTTVEPTTVAPTTAPSATEWYIKGTFNSWGTTNQLRGSGNELTANVYIDSSQVQEFKVWNKTDDKYYGNKLSGGSVATEIKDYNLYQKDDPSKELNVKFKPTESGIYKFTFNPSTLILNAELVQSGLNAEVSAPESVKAGETFSITAKAIPDATITPASYKFTIKIGDTVVVKDAVSTTAQYTYNKATISAPAYASAYVEAFDADGNIIGVSPTVECAHKTTVAYDDLTVKLSADGSEVVAGTEVTLTAAATPASYVSSYDFLISKSYDFNDTDLVTKTSSSSTLKYRFDTIGTYYVKVVAHNKYGNITNTADATSNIIEISVVNTSGEHEVTFYFKAPSAFAYFPKMTLDGTALEVTKEAELGASFTGSVTFYWYKATATVDSSNTHTLSVSTRRTNASGSMTGNFYGSKYWLAIDNLMSGKTLANLTSLQPYIRNYYHSPLHTVYAGVADDGTLGFTNINGTRYAMGTYADGDPSTANAALSIKAATAAQKSATQLEKYSEVQTCLLDVNLDGRVDVLDATMIQRALVNIQ